VLVSVGVNGKTGWQRGPDGQTGQYAVVDITGNALATVDFERWREPELILLKAADKAARLTTAPDENLDGRPCSVVVLRAPFGDVSVSLFIDKKTKLIGRMSYSDGGNAESDDFADYRDVAGIKLAYKRVSSGAGRATKLEVKTFEVDPKLDATAFDKPSVN